LTKKLKIWLISRVIGMLILQVNKIEKEKVEDEIDPESKKKKNLRL